MPEYHRWACDRTIGVPTRPYCEMTLCGRAPAFRIRYTFQHDADPAPTVREWAVCPMHAAMWCDEKGIPVPESREPSSGEGDTTIPG